MITLQNLRLPSLLPVPTLILLQHSNAYMTIYTWLVGACYKSVTVIQTQYH